MIEINLLPEELKAKASSRKNRVTIEVKYLVYLIPITLILLILVHIYLGLLLVAKHNQIASLNKKWLSQEPEKRQLDIFNKESALQTQDSSTIKAWLDERVVWSEKLVALSDSLLPGIWFTELSVIPPNFTLRASVVSLQKEEMDIIKKFIDLLKTDTAFFKNFNSLELSSVQTRTIGSFDVLDFTLAGTLR
ncbi:MAG: hypothetical protein AMJ95_03535 [Omnitrophica WOR_2 bacterium SM23_72]|nr:MAG: hypothetical protein AMJ95_03535 [Omnitrophica WOR_2 bacterium SM23_72]